MNIFRLKRKTKKISLKRYLLLIFSLIMTTFAWFAYSKILETDINFDLLPWDIKFFIGEVEKFNPIDIVMQDLYPGMEDRTVDVIIQNNGRVEAGVQFQVNEVTLLGKTYNLVSDPNTELGEDDLYVQKATLVNSVLSQYVINDPEKFPFTVYIASVTRVAPVSEGILTIRISWPGDNDELDTKWGYDVAQFYNSGEAVGQPLKISLQIDVTQNEFTYASPITLFDREGENESGLHIGDFVEYDAGTWTQAEIDAIQTGEIGNEVTANGSTDLPTEAFQFGGFAEGASRNENVSVEGIFEGYYNYVKDKSTEQAITGWRVFDIEEDGTVILISAGNTENYYQPYDENQKLAHASEYILTGVEKNNESANYTPRNWNVYINSSQKAVSAAPIKLGDAENWFNKYFYEGFDIYKEEEISLLYSAPYLRYQNIHDNYSYYWYCQSNSGIGLNAFSPNARQGSSFSASQVAGVRMLVTLSPEVEFTSRRTGTKILTGGNMDTYGGDQTYNVWRIKPEETITEPEYVTADKIFDSTGNNANGLHIGDFVEYDAGVWTQEEIDAIQTGEKGNEVTANGSTSLPNERFQFGGFTAGSSRNGNAAPNTKNGNYAYVKDKLTGRAVTGWRVLDIKEDGSVILISAGNPEDYYQAYVQGGNAGYINQYILTGQVNSNWSISEANNYTIRNWDNYINASQKAVSAMPLTRTQLNNWLDEYIDSTLDNTGVFKKMYEEPFIKYQNIIDNYSIYWTSEGSSTYGKENICAVDPGTQSPIQRFH